MRPRLRSLIPLSLVGLSLAGITAIASDPAGPQARQGPHRAGPATNSAGIAADQPGRFAGGARRRGETLYRQNCSSCHGADLSGRGMAPSLVGVTRHMTDEGIVAHARMIGQMMCCARHIRNIADGEFADIVAYFHAVDSGPVTRRRHAGQASGGMRCCCSG
jgi:mono/diheme cytochrome c family protein